MQLKLRMISLAVIAGLVSFGAAASESGFFSTPTEGGSEIDLGEVCADSSLGQDLCDAWSFDETNSDGFYHGRYPRRGPRHHPPRRPGRRWAERGEQCSLHGWGRGYRRCMPGLVCADVGYRSVGVCLEGCYSDYDCNYNSYCSRRGYCMEYGRGGRRGDRWDNDHGRHPNDRYPGRRPGRRVGR